MTGKFITFEGSEGSGKSTQINLLRQYLESKGKKIIFVREPGSTTIGEKIRGVLLDVSNEKMSPICEILLYMAARAQLVEEQIVPALKQGKIVLCDRFLDSTIVYQGYGNKIDLKFIKSVGKVVTQNIVPDMTFFFDIDAKKGLSRIKRSKDRIELRSLDYHNRVRYGYCQLAKKDSKRIKVIDGDKSQEEIQISVRHQIDKIFRFSS